jgi:hypothetical protein
VTFLPECYNSNRQGVVSKNFPFVSLKGKSFLFSEEVWRGPQEDRRSAFQQTRGFTYRTKERKKGQTVYCLDEREKGFKVWTP